MLFYLITHHLRALTLQVTALHPNQRWWSPSLALLAQRHLVPKRYCLFCTAHSMFTKQMETSIITNFVFCLWISELHKLNFMHYWWTEHCLFFTRWRRVKMFTATVNLKQRQPLSCWSQEMTRLVNNRSHMKSVKLLVVQSLKLILHFKLARKAVVLLPISLPCTSKWGLIGHLVQSG